MYFKTLLLAGLMLASISSFGGSITGGEKDPYEKTFITNPRQKTDDAFQRQLVQSAAWQHFLSAHPQWVVTFNESNQKPHRAFGSPVTVVAGVDAQSTALNFINNELKEFNIPVSELKLQSTTSSKYQNVIFTQVHAGLEVLFSRLTVKMTTDNNVISWGADVFSDIEISTTAAIDETTAKASATKNISQVTSVSAAVLKILPVPANHSNVYHLVYEMTVNASIPSSPAKYYTLVDANTGEILYRQNHVRTVTPLNTDVNVTGTLYKTGLINPSSVEPLLNLKVVVGGNTYYTDNFGDALIPGSTSQTATFSLEGKWSKVVTDGGSTSPSFTQTLNAGSNAASFTSTASIRHLSGYYHVNIVHDFMKQYFPAFTTMDNPLPTNIDVSSGSCNAFYSGSDINFYATGGGCVSMAQIGDVVYHEYGHGISDKFYQSLGASFDNGSMGEGYSDVWGFAITQYPYIGRGYTGTSSGYIRNYNFTVATSGARRKVYPQDLTGEPHDNGEIIAGAWYDVALNIGSWPDISALFANTYFDLLNAPDGNEGQLFSDILLSALQYDDNDGDLSNGTPNDQAILDAFSAHGIFLPVDIQHSEILSAAPSAPIPVNVDVVNTLPFAATININVLYRTTITGIWSKVSAVKGAGNTYTANIPAQPAGTLVRYYVEARDNSNALLKTIPAEAAGNPPNIPYFILVGYNSTFLEDFEGPASNWLTGISTDKATSGQWIIGSPIPSYNGSEICQPGTQHTPGGSRCAVTGNAGWGDPIGTNDVDGGKTTLQSPVYDISTYNKPAFAFWRWYTNDQGSNPRSSYWQVYASKDGVTYTNVEWIVVPDHSYRRFVFRVADYLPGATQVTLRFVAQDNVGSLIEAAVDDVQLLETESPTGIAEQSVAGLFSAYPNPAKDLITVTVPGSKTAATLFIYNTVGAIVYQQPVNASPQSSAINVSVKDLAKGIYRIVFQNETSLSHLNVMVQH